MLIAIVVVRGNRAKAEASHDFSCNIRASFLRLSFVGSWPD